jgi:hypothetical integral membrane protein (TIGR02206 family)
MRLFSLEHLSALATILVVAIALAIAAHARPGPWALTASRTLAIGIVAIEASWWLVWLPTRGSWSPASGLPLQLCDIAAFIAGAALWWRQALLVELTYFWGLGGSLQAVLTPDLKEHFPSYPYWQFYVAHGGVIVAALLLVVGLRLWPLAGAVKRIFLITLAFAVGTGLVDLVTGGNYLYLRQPPSSGSLLTFMGPWPWYIVSGTLLALIVLVILDLPFRRARRP